MNIIDMRGDFENFYDEAKVIGKWTAFKKYYEKYSELFDLMIEGLYMIEFNEFKNIVEKTNFDTIFHRLKLIDESMVEKIKEITKKSIKGLEFEKEFDLYIGGGVGHACGVTLPTKKPSIYIGLECIDKCDINFLIPHEVNHMVRINSIKNINLYSFAERVMTEGLGVIYPLILNHLPINMDNISKTLVIEKKQVEILQEKYYELKQKVINHFEDTLNYKLMNEFFTIRNDETTKTILSGYYIGLKIIEKMICEGDDIRELTKMPINELVLRSSI
ncbi:MAG: hypothetical protein SO128_11825 [Clostridium cadaveris]|uniref:hypothetical protein n=1 Tax=Clostridium cadaveris TaxID=1529 RepID=UPI002A8FAE2C|nr:hypothetical protein [Clostridium cadaveris]